MSALVAVRVTETLRPELSGEYAPGEVFELVASVEPCATRDGAELPRIRAELEAGRTIQVGAYTLAPVLSTAALPTEPEKVGPPCPSCAAVGRLTFTNPDGTCRRADVHKEPQR